jgi:hypothetical protein
MGYKNEPANLVVYFLEEIIDIFQQAMRNACNAHNVGIEDNYLCL